MQIKEILDNVKKSETYKNWPNKDNVIIAHIFKLYEKESNDFQVGFYNKDDDTITPIVFHDNAFKIEEAQKIFKQENSEVKPLDIEKVTIDINDAAKTAQDLQREKYKGQDPTKVLLILQQINDIPTYNITFVTVTFKTLNIKINAITGEIINDGITSIFDFKKGGSGEN